MPLPTGVAYNVRPSQRNAFDFVYAIRDFDEAWRGAREVLARAGVLERAIVQRETLQSDDDEDEEAAEDVVWPSGFQGEFRLF